MYEKFIKGEPQRKFIDSIIADNVNSLCQAIADGADINLPDENNNTPIMLAIKEYSDKCTKQLLIEEVDLEKINNDGKTAVDICLEEGDVFFLRMLIRAGANIDNIPEKSKDMYADTISHSAHKREKKNLNDEFQYGLCKTDYKDGLEIRTCFRTIDYIKDEPYASEAKTMLEKLGLPFPKDHEIFRGTHHDLLFLNSHGVVLRIGPTNVEDLVNLAISQPLGWIEGNSKDFSIAIYPGVEIYSDFLRNESDSSKVSGDLYKTLETTQNSSDINSDNTGIIRIQTETGEMKNVMIVIDIDNEFIGTSDYSKDISDLRSSKISIETEKGNNKSQATLNTLTDMFHTAQNTDIYKRAFQLHQPLRNKFWRAFKNDNTISANPDKKHRDEFWKKCREVTNNPQPVAMYNWSHHINDKGVKIWKQETVLIPNLVLYTPWTGKIADKHIAKAPKLNNRKPDSKLPA